MGNQCEYEIGGACVTPNGLPGVYNGECTGFTPDCIAGRQPFITGRQANFSTRHPLLWGMQYGVGWLMNLSSRQTGMEIGINANGCIVFADGSEQCSASSGLGSPNYNSGWTAINAGESIVLTHDLNTLNTLVYMEFRNGGNIHQSFYGGTAGFDQFGAGWSDKSTTEITVYRQSEDSLALEVLVLMWDLDGASSGGGSLPPCVEGQMLQYNSGAWECVFPPSGSSLWSGSSPGDIYYDQGDVGIGYATPDSIFHIVEDVDSNRRWRPQVIVQRDYTNDHDLGLRFKTTISSGDDKNLDIFYRHGGGDEGAYIDLNTLNQPDEAYDPSGAEISVRASGNVGIGTSNPQARLTVNNTGYAIRLEREGQLDWGIHQANLATPGLGIRNDASPVYRLFITDDGNTGIGTNTPDGKLNIYTGNAGGVSPNVNWDDLVIESDGIAGITILTPNTAAPAIAFGDSNSNVAGRILYEHASDLMTFRTGGVDNMYINNIGDVGIGTVPDNGVNLHIHEGTGPSRFKMTSAIGGWEILTIDSFMIMDTVQGNIGLAINSQGNLGLKNVGTPLEALHVGGNILTVATSDTFIKIASPDGNLGAINLYDYLLNEKWSLGKDTVDNFFIGEPRGSRLVIEPGGNVGISINEPQSRLHINDSGTAGGITLSNDYENFQMFFEEGDKGDFHISYDGTGGKDVIFQNNGNILLANNTIGVVGIGTDNPYAMLDVQGDYVRFEDPNGNAETWFPFGDGEVYITGHRDGVGDGDINLRSWGSTGGYSIKMVIKGDTGNVGIGTAAPGSKLDVAGSARVSGSIEFDGELLPDGVTCTNGDVLVRAGIDDWDCASGIGVDTNAQTICPDNEFLDGDGQCLTAGEIVAGASIAWNCQTTLGSNCPVGSVIRSITEDGNGIITQMECCTLSLS